MTSYVRKATIEGFTPQQAEKLREIVAARRGTHRMEVIHDEGCPCIDGQSLGDCTCRELSVTLERLQ